MGNKGCCDTSTNRMNRNRNSNLPDSSNSKRNTIQTNTHRDTFPPNTYKQPDLLYQQKTPNYNEGSMDEKLDLRQNQGRSIDDDVKNSFSGKNLSPTSSKKNEPLQKSRFKSFKISRSFKAHDKIIVCMIELEDKKIATGSYDNTIKIWDLNNYSEQPEKILREQGKVFSLLEFEPNVILTAIDKTPDNIQDISQINPDDILINKWELNNLSDESNDTFDTRHQLRINCLVKCGDKHFASCSNDGNIIIWDYYLKRDVKELKGHGDCVLCLIQLNNGKLCSGSADNTIKIWNWEAGECEYSIEDNSSWVKCLCELSNGYIVAGTHDNLITIWNERGQRVNQLEGHGRSVRSICEIDKSNYIASASFDHTIRIWDIFTKECLQTLNEHTSSVINVIYHSDGYLISCSNDKTIKVWKNV